MRFIVFAILVVTGLFSAKAWAAAFNLEEFNGVLSPVRGIEHSDVFIRVQTDFPDFDYSQLQVSSNTAWISPEVDVAGQRLRLKLNIKLLPPTRHEVVITATHGSNVRRRTISVEGMLLNVVRLLDDPVRSRTYGIQRNGYFTESLHGGLLVIDPHTGQVLKNIRVGSGPTSMALSNDRSELFVLNGQDSTLTVIDLETLEVKETLWAPKSVEYSYNRGEIAVGSGDILYYTETNNQPWLRVFDRSTKKVLQTVNIDSLIGVGDFVLDASKQTLIAWSQHGGDNNNSGTMEDEGKLHRYAVSETGTLTHISDANPVKIESGYAPMLISNNDQSLFFQNRILSPTNISTVRTTLPDPVRSISPGGEVAITADSVYQVATGNKIADLPGEAFSHVQVVTSDYSHLVYFDAEERRIGTLNLMELIGHSVLGRVLSPAPGATVSVPSTLSWSSEPGATIYLVYLGDTKESVEMASPDSPYYLGFSLTSSISAPSNLAAGETYYWRVDTVFGDVTSQGAVYSFSIPPSSPMPEPVLSAGSPITATSLAVTWTDNSNETGFELQYRRTGSFGWSILSQAIGPNQTSVTIPGLQSEMAYEIRVRAIGLTGNSAWSNTVVMTTAVPTVDLVITTPPVSSLAVIGSGTNAPLTVAVNKAEVSYQWFKDSALIPGANQPSYLPSALQPQHAGSYHCRIWDAADSVETVPVTLGVIDMKATPNPLLIAVGGAMSLGMDIYPANLASQLTYEWRAIEVESLQSVGTVAGVNGPTLSITNATAAAATSYFCNVGYAGKTVIVGYYTAQLLSVPQIAPIPETRRINGYWVSIPVDVTGATAVRVTGLPEGVRYDAVSRSIIGRSSVVQSHTVTVEAENASGAAVPVTFLLHIIPYPQALAGTYRGIIEQGGFPPYQHGGRITFQITRTGAATGTVTVQGKTSRLVMEMSVAEADGSAGYLEATYRDFNGTPYVVKVAVGRELSQVYLSLISVVGPIPLGTGFAVRNPWTVANPAPGTGAINVALQLLPENHDSSSYIPLGTSFMNLKLNARGVVNVRGRLADGKVVTASTIMGPAWDIPVFVSPYKNKGGLTTLIHYASGEASGTARWGKDDQGQASKDRLFRNGFKLKLSVVGGRYVRPTANEAWPLFPVLAPQSLLGFYRGGLDESISQALSFDSRYRITLPRQSPENPYGITVKLNLATGTFTGKFKLVNENVANSSQPVRRTATYHGCLIPGLGKGEGFFLLPELPMALPGSNLSNTLIWSGEMEMLPGGVE